MDVRRIVKCSHIEENSEEKIPVFRGTSDQQRAYPYVYDVLVYSIAGAFNATRQGSERYISASTIDETLIEGS